MKKKPDADSAAMLELLEEVVEQEVADNLEKLCGGWQEAFHLKRLYHDVSATGLQDEVVADIFRKIARDKGYSDAAISAYLEYVG